MLIELICKQNTNMVEGHDEKKRCCCFAFFFIFYCPIISIIIYAGLETNPIYIFFLIWTLTMPNLLTAVQKLCFRRKLSRTPSQWLSSHWDVDAKLLFTKLTTNCLTYVNNKSIYFTRQWTTVKVMKGNRHNFLPIYK